MKYQENQRAQTIDELFNEYDLLCHEIAKSRGLSDSAYDVLRTVLVLGEGCSQTAVYQKGYFNKQTINSAVKRLVADGLLEMKAGRGRENLLYYTEKGRKLVERGVMPVERAEAEIYDEFSDEEYSELLRLVNRYVTSFRSKAEMLIGDYENE